MNDIYDYPEINSILGNDFWDGINNQLKEIARENGVFVQVWTASI